ncbi:hypothetical protein ACC697_39000, partial [Rhizobium ruizarguesonis]
ALRELVRVVRPGGRIAVATCDQEENKAPHYLASEVYRDLFPNRSAHCILETFGWTIRYHPSRHEGT